MADFVFYFGISCYLTFVTAVTYGSYYYTVCLPNPHTHTHTHTHITVLGRRDPSSVFLLTVPSLRTQKVFHVRSMRRGSSRRGCYTEVAWLHRLVVSLLSSCFHSGAWMCPSRISWSVNLSMKVKVHGLHRHTHTCTHTPSTLLF